MNNAERAEKSAELPDTSEFEGEIRDLIRSRDVTFLRTPPKSGGDLNNLNSLIQRAVSQAVREHAEMLSDHLGKWRPDMQSPPTALTSE
jgi:hypothetical protein